MSESPAPIKNADPRYSPTYPHRVHAFEREKWRAVQADCRTKAEAAIAKLPSLLNGPRAEEARFLHAQILGSLDQVNETVGRLPGTVGGIHEEEIHRLEEAHKALNRVLTQWDGLGS